VKGSTAIPQPRLLAERLRSLQPDRRISGRNNTKADVLLYRLDEAAIAVKDYAARPFLFRNILGRYLIRREARIYSAASGLPGIARFHGRLGPYSLATDWIEGKPLVELLTKGTPEGCFARLREIVSALHQHGIALADLHLGDVLVGAEGEVHVIDLATAMLLGERPSRVRRGLFARLCDQDRVAVARMEARFRGEDIDEAVDAVGERAASWHRRGRRVKSMLRRLKGRRG
jgi:hypothetical protein